MARGGWVDRVTHFIATGEETANGGLKDAEIVDNVGTVIDRNRDFSSLQDFAKWCKEYKRF